MKPHLRKVDGHWYCKDELTTAYQTYTTAAKSPLTSYYIWAMLTGNLTNELEKRHAKNIKSNH